MWSKTNEIVSTKEIKKENIVQDNNNNLTETTKDNAKIVVIYGRKGVGKTYSCFSLLQDGSNALVISFDGMSKIISQNPEFKKIDFKIYDAEMLPRFIMKNQGNKISAIESVENSYENMQKIMSLLLNAKDKSFDYVIIDGFNIAQKYAESYMRFNHQLSFSGGVPNMNFWKERNAVLNAILTEAKRITKKLIIYTLYTKDHTIIESDEPITREEPNYVEDVMTMSDIVIKIETKIMKNKENSNIQYYARIETSKTPEMKIGFTFETTNKKLKDIIKIEG
jgi:hypothetical protein